MPSKPLHAILTGDVVGSQDLASSTQTNLSTFLLEAARHAGLGETLEVFRGDSWQVRSPDPAKVVAQALALRSHLLSKREIETRIAIGIGTVDSLRKEKISLSHGEAFVLSGRALTEMPDERRLTIATSTALPPATRDLLDAACTLLDATSASWTAKQAQAVALASLDQPQVELAKAFEPTISAQAFGKHLASAQWKLVNHALIAIAKALAAEFAD